MFTRKKEETKKNTQEKRNVFRRVGTVVSGFAASLAYAVPAFAAVDYSYLKPIINLKTLLVQFGEPVGAVVILYGGWCIAESWHRKDQGGQYSAINIIAAGGILLGISAGLDVLVG